MDIIKQLDRCAENLKAAKDQYDVFQSCKEKLYEWAEKLNIFERHLDAIADEDLFNTDFDILDIGIYNETLITIVVNERFTEQLNSPLEFFAKELHELDNINNWEVARIDSSDYIELINTENPVCISFQLGDRDMINFINDHIHILTK